MAKDYTILNEKPEEEIPDTLWNFVNDFMDGKVFIKMYIIPDPKDEIPKD